MPYPLEHVVDTISTGLQDRTLVVNCEDQTGGRFVEIRQQSYGGSRVGWFTQSSVQVPPETVAALRTALGIAGALPQMVAAKQERLAVQKNQPEQPCPDAVLAGSISSAELGKTTPALRVWHAESA